MTDWLPSLNALRAFEATARHLSFVRASEELHVTPAAVKQLVRKLEEGLGAALVERAGRGLRLTAAGATGLEELGAGFGRIARGVELIRAHSGRRRLIVSAEPSFATAWLVPRLERFRNSEPEIDVLIESSLHLVDLARGAADVAIRFGAAQDPGLIAHRLFDEELCAFCSPSLARGLKGISDLARAPVIRWEISGLEWASATRAWMDWSAWLQRVGATGVEPRGGLRFSDYNLAVQAAVAGQGVVLGSLPVLRDLVEAGLLVRAVPQTLRTDIGYDAVATHSAMHRPEVRAFFGWITAEAVRQGAPTAPDRCDAG